MKIGFLLLTFLKTFSGNPVKLVNRDACTIMKPGTTVMGIQATLSDEAEIHFIFNGIDYECGAQIENFRIDHDTLSVNLGSLPDNGNGGTLANYAVQVSKGGRFEKFNGACNTGISQSQERDPFDAISFVQEDTNILVRGNIVTIVGVQGFNQADVRVTESCSITFENIEGEFDIDDIDEEIEEAENQNQGGVSIDEPIDLMQLFLVTKTENEIKLAVFGKVDLEA
eukprot:snap_masked-scaffold_50-processed-gene-1.44-mRNA-1 protein AED:1.00 eAED:1.00 QI:0/0/0/0/1/1/3/0/225